MTGNNPTETARLQLRVTPNARRNELTGYREGVLQVKVAAPPERGKANMELIKHLSGVLGVSKSSLRLLQGHTSRNKVIAVGGLDETEVKQRIAAALNSP